MNKFVTALCLYLSEACVNHGDAGKADEVAWDSRLLSLPPMAAELGESGLTKTSRWLAQTFLTGARPIGGTTENIAMFERVSVVLSSPALGAKIANVQIVVDGRAMPRFELGRHSEGQSHGVIMFAELLDERGTEIAECMVFPPMVTSGGGSVIDFNGKCGEVPNVVLAQVAEMRVEWRNGFGNVTKL